VHFNKLTVKTLFGSKILDNMAKNLGLPGSYSDNIKLSLIS
jgi:hypothetical protein